MIPGLGTSPGEGHGNTFQCSCLESPMDRGVWRALLSQSRTLLSDEHQRPSSKSTKMCLPEDCSTCCKVTRSPQSLQSYLYVPLIQLSNGSQGALSKQQQQQHPQRLVRNARSQALP